MLIRERQWRIPTACYGDQIWPLNEQLSVFFLFYCHNWVHVLNFLVTFLLLASNTALYTVPATIYLIIILMVKAKVRSSEEKKFGFPLLLMD